VSFIYFDYNATTPLDAGVREAMLPFLDGTFGNPSSVHRLGRAARSGLDEARYRVSQIWDCKPSEVIFTSGGTESNNLAIFGVARAFKAKGHHLITSSVEHHSVLHCFEYLAKREGFDVTFLPASREGLVDPDRVASAITPRTTLVSIMAANNETGVIQPVADIGAICRDRKVLFHTDAAQWFGKEPFASIGQFNADLVSCCAHKFHGPKGAGALFIRSPLLPDPILFGGGHENERRAGTENVAAVAGFAEATSRFLRTPVFPRDFLHGATEELLVALEKIPGVQFQGSRASRLANTVSFTVEGTDSIALLASLDIEGICASSGSACSAGSLEPSHVLKAMGVAPQKANSFVRFSLGRDSTLQEVDFVGKTLPHLIRRIRGE
jgi:cysteine desulfurase